jgi:two-component system, NarL family, sensor histidine kinase UhpB
MRTNTLRIEDDVATRLSLVAVMALTALLLGAYALHDLVLVSSHLLDGPVEQVLALLVAMAVGLRVAHQRRLFGQLQSARRHELEALTRFETIYERAPIGMGLVSLDGHLRNTNPVMREITGFSAEELASQNVLDYTLPDDVAETSELFGGLFTGKHDSYRHEMRLRAKDGSVVWVDSATVLLHDPDGKPQVVLSMASNITERRLAEEQLRRQNAQLEASECERARLLARTVEVAEQERMRIATELHDGPIQKLTVVGFNVDRLGMRIARNEPGAEELMQEIRADLQAQMFALRSVMSDLRPPILDERNLAAALNDCAQQVFADVSVEYETTCALGSDWPAPEIETAVYRVVREALINIRRHAAATRVDVAIERDGESLRLLVTDDGGGFDHADSGIEHFGLLGMQERIGSLGGLLEVQSVIGTGTRVEATLPWKSRLAPTAA